MLERFGEYGLESLALAGELPALRAWHPGHYLELVEAAESRLRERTSAPGSIDWRRSTHLRAVLELEPRHLTATRR